MNYARYAIDESIFLYTAILTYTSIILIKAAEHSLDIIKTYTTGTNEASFLQGIMLIFLI